MVAFWPHPAPPPPLPPVACAFPLSALNARPNPTAAGGHAPQIIVLVWEFCRRSWPDTPARRDFWGYLLAHHVLLGIFPAQPKGIRPQRSSILFSSWMAVLAICAAASVSAGWPWWVAGCLAAACIGPLEIVLSLFFYATQTNVPEPPLALKAHALGPQPPMHRKVPSATREGVSAGFWRSLIRP